MVFPNQSKGQIHRFHLFHSLSSSNLNSSSTNCLDISMFGSHQCSIEHFLEASFLPCIGKLYDLACNGFNKKIKHLQYSIFSVEATQQTFVLMKTSLVFVFRRRLQDVFKTFWWRRIYSPESYLFRRRLQDVFKTSSSRPIYSSWSYVFKTSSKRFQDVFKTSSRRPQDIFKTSSRHLQDVFKTSSRHLQDIFKTSSRRLQNILKTSSRRLLDIFKTFSRRVIKLNCSW